MRDEVTLVARGIATAVAPEDGLTGVQANLLGAIAEALTGVTVDYHALEPLGPEDFAKVLADKDLVYRQRIVHHMVLAELVLRPLPVAVAFRVAKTAEALGVKDDFVRVARRYAQGAYGLAWMDLERSGFVEHVQDAGGEAAQPQVRQKLAPAHVDPELAAKWIAFEGYEPGSLGRTVWDLYDGRGFALPGTEGGAPAYLAQHDFVHVIADYGTNLKGELEVFALLGRADPDPKGFAWLATLVGLFETGFIADTGFFERDTRERHVGAPGMHRRVADAIRRGKIVCDHLNMDLFEYDFHAVAQRPVEEVRAMFALVPKSQGACESGSAGLFDPEGMSEMQRQYAARRRGEA